jgi:hypothetical protein
MQNQNGPSDGKHSPQTSALSMGPPSAQPAVHLSSIPPATDAIDADWEEDGTPANAAQADSANALDAARSHDVEAGTPADGTSKNAASSSSQAPREPEPPAPQTVEDAGNASALSSGPSAPPPPESSPTPVDLASRPSDTREPLRPPKVRSLRSLQPTLLLFTGGPAPGGSNPETANAEPFTRSEASPPTLMSSPPGPEPSTAERSDPPLAASSALTGVDVSPALSAASPSGEPPATARKGPSGGSQLQSLHPTHVGPWHVPPEAGAAAQNRTQAQPRQAELTGSAQAAREAAPVATSHVSIHSVSSLQAARARATAAPRHTAWSIAVAASAALAIAAGYWAFRPTTAVTAPATNTAARGAPHRASSVAAPEVKSAPPAQHHTRSSGESSPEPDSPGVSPERASDEATDSQPRKPAAPGEPVSVDVKVVPATAILFQGSRRLGEGSVTLNVTRGKPIKLVILHRGYYYRRVKIDGSEPEVTVRLKKIMPDTAKGTP